MLPPDVMHLEHDFNLVGTQSGRLESLESLACIYLVPCTSYIAFFCGQSSLKIWP